MIVTYISTWCVIPSVDPPLVPTWRHCYLTLLSGLPTPSRRRVVQKKQRTSQVKPFLLRPLQAVTQAKWWWCSTRTSVNSCRQRGQLSALPQAFPTAVTKENVVRVHRPTTVVTDNVDHEQVACVHVTPPEIVLQPWHHQIVLHPQVTCNHVVDHHETVLRPQVACNHVVDHHETILPRDMVAYNHVDHHETGSISRALLWDIHDILYKDYKRRY